MATWATWLSGVKEVVANVLCGRVTPTSTSSMSLEGCELGVVSSDYPLSGSTMITFPSEDDSNSSLSSLDQEDGPLLHVGAVNGKTTSMGQVKVHYKGCPDIPVRTKGAQGVFLGGQLYVGGGYVNDSKLSTVIYKFDPLFELWDSLPPCPMKLFGMSTFNQCLVIVGGKEAGKLGSTSSNKLFTLDKDTLTWSNSLPPMTFARTSPVVISYDQYLIVAGGNKGSLDYNMEVYNGHSQRWTSAPALPIKCFPPTSAVTGQSWYLLNQEDGTVLCADIPLLLEGVTGDGDKSSVSDDGESKTKLWATVPKPPCEPTQLTSISGRLLAIVHETSPVKVSSYILDAEGCGWSYSYKLPNLCGHSSALPDVKDGTYLFGGEGGAKQYSNKLYRVTLRQVQSTGVHEHQTKCMKPPITFRL